MFEVQKFLFHVERGLYEFTKFCLFINFLYIHPKASKQPLIAVPIIMNNPVGQWFETPGVFCFFFQKKYRVVKQNFQVVRFRDFEHMRTRMAQVFCITSRPNIYLLIQSTKLRSEAMTSPES